MSLLLSQVGAPPAAVATNTLDLDPPRKRKAAQPDDLISFNASLASIRPARFLDLENPWAKRRRLLDDLSLSSNMSLYPPPLLPPYYDLETPRAKRRRQEDAETTNLSLYSQTAVVPPFQYQDLDTSRQKRRRLEDAETLNLSLYPPSVATPFGYQDLESPARKRPRVSDTETLNLSLYPPPRLLQYVDLDTIRAKRRRLDDLDPFNASLASLTPFNLPVQDEVRASRRRMDDAESVNLSMYSDATPKLIQYFDLETQRAKRRIAFEDDPYNTSLYPPPVFPQPVQWYELDTRKARALRSEDIEPYNMSLYPPPVAPPVTTVGGGAPPRPYWLTYQMAIDDDETILLAAVATVESLSSRSRHSEDDEVLLLALRALIETLALR